MLSADGKTQEYFTHGDCRPVSSVSSDPAQSQAVAAAMRALQDKNKLLRKEKEDLIT